MVDMEYPVRMRQIWDLRAKSKAAERIGDMALGLVFIQMAAQLEIILEDLMFGPGSQHDLPVGAVIGRVTG